jgi:hypothetical protein
MEQAIKAEMFAFAANVIMHRSKGGIERLLVG